MDRENYNRIIERYLEKFDYTNAKGPEEWFKWAAIDCFRKNWDLDAPDFYSMFSRAVKQFSVLIDNNHASPVAGLKTLMKQPGEEKYVREAFRDLYVPDGGDIAWRQKKAETFVQTINKRIEKHWPGSHKYLQSMRSAVLFLSMHEPADNYILFWSRAVNWAEYTEFGSDFGAGASFSLPTFYRMCDEVHAEILKDTRLQSCNKKRMEAANVTLADDYHTLVYDIIYCATCYNLYVDLPTYEPGTAKRLERAKERAELENLECKMVSAEKELNDLSATKCPSIDLTGHEVGSISFGKGQVLNQTEKKISIQFKDSRKLFQYPDAFIKNYLTPVYDSDLITIQRIAEYRTRLETLKKTEEHARTEYTKALSAFQKKWPKSIHNEAINTDENE